MRFKFLPQSDAYWAVWIAVMFLVPELLAFFGVIPLYTLSHTSWINEQLHPWLRPLLWGFLVGLATHICYGTALGRALGGGIAIALVLHFLWGFRV